MKKVSNAGKKAKKTNGKKQKLSLILSVFLLCISLVTYYFFDIDILESLNALYSEYTQTTEHLPSSAGVQLSKCIDGDTARFLIDGEEVKVRFSGINTPEHSNNKKEAYGEEAATFTCTMLTEAQMITIEWDTTQEKSYNRELGIIFVGDTNLNLELVRQGLADLRYLKDTMPYANDYQIALETAKANNLMLWS